jgi:two-component system phosphate regulon sensor histidine kinase PhoR
MMLNDANALSQGNHKISADISKNLNLVGAFDELQSALSNLVSNAIRYTPKGGEIQIRWQLRRDQAVFSVSDNGIGIPQQHIDRLTERFYRVDRGRSRETGGTGLGLSIVKHILTRHQAKLEIVSEVGVGSTFSAIFPKARTIQK